MATAFKHAVHQNLECPVCLGFFKEPKILSCSHTFCKGCLKTLHESYVNKDKLSCPVCREETLIPSGDVNTLQTNIALRSLVADVETQAQVCTNCSNPLAAAYCNECGIYLCETCREMHSKWAMFSGHSIVPATDILSGKIPLKRRSKCQKHPNEDEECFCVDCGKYVCFRCGMLEHAHEGHKIVQAEMHETEQKKNIDQMISKAERKVRDLDKYVTFVEDQCEMLQKLESQLTSDIDEAFDEAVHKLTERKVMLKSEVEHQIKELVTVLVDMKEKGCRQIVQVNAVSGLVKNGLKVPLQKEALTTHRTLCQELEELLGRTEHDDQPRRIVEEGKQIHFKRSQRSDGLELGQVRKRNLKWVLHTEKQLPIANSMEALALSPTNSMAVGSSKPAKGDILVYSVDGIQQETLLKAGNIYALHFMSDGSYVTRDDQNRISLYTSQNEKREVKFEAPGNTEGGLGGITVDKDGHILSSYCETKTIRIFHPEGGKAVREIPCGGSEPYQIRAMYSSKMIVVKSGRCTVCIIDSVSGAKFHSITKDGEDAFPAVSIDDSVIIAWVKIDQGLLSIGHYTSELKHIKDLLIDFKITKPSRLWYHLQQFKTGEIAFCTPDRLYIFRETWKVVLKRKIDDV